MNKGIYKSFHREGGQLNKLRNNKPRIAPSRNCRKKLFLSFLSCFRRISFKSVDEHNAGLQIVYEMIDLV